MNPFDADIFAADIGCLPCCNSCPTSGKMLLPPLTESTGDWYADCAAAEAALAFVFESCSIYAKPTGSGSISSASAISSGFTVTSDSAFEGVERYAVRYETGVSVMLDSTFNAVQVTHDTTSFSINADPFSIILIAEDGTTIFSDTGPLLAPPITTVYGFTIPAPGRYFLFIEVACEADSPTPISFTETLTVEFGELTGGGPPPDPPPTFTPGSVDLLLAQALYDTGGASPSCLNCGDSCPP